MSAFNNCVFSVADPVDETENAADMFGEYVVSASQRELVRAARNTTH